MAVNSSISELDAAQIVKRTYQVADDAVRTVLATTTGMAIVLDRSDEVTTYAGTVTGTADLTSASTGVVVAAFSVVGMQRINLFTKTTTTITDAQVLTLEISPSDTADVWIATALTVTPSTTANTVIAGTVLSNLTARRARVSTTAITSGTYSVYVVGQG